MLIKTLNHWFIHFQKYFFVYKDGFFDLSYLANNPEAMIKSFAKMPFNKHYINKNCFVSNNPFISGELYYQEIEEELWFFFGEVNYKTNVSYNLIYDNYLPIDYYTLSFNQIVNSFAEVGFMVDDVSLKNTSWSIFKPKGNLKNYHFKNNAVANMFFCFTKKWYDKNIKTKIDTTSAFENFMQNEEVNYIVLNSEIPENGTILKRNIERFKTNEQDVNGMREDIFTLFFNFIQKVNKQEKPLENITVTNKDRVKVYKIEAYLLENLQSKFMGIDELSDIFRISPTKMKHDFKIIFGQSIFSYFQSKQIELAKEVLAKGNYPINEIATVFGYSNASKFSSAFKKKTGFLPSEIAKKEM